MSDFSLVPAGDTYMGSDQSGTAEAAAPTNRPESSPLSLTNPYARNLEFRFRHAGHHHSIGIPSRGISSYCYDCNERG